MNKDIQSIIKKAALKYSLNYNENGKTPTVCNKNGVKKELSVNDMKKTFEDFGLMKNMEWEKGKKENSLIWKDNKKQDSNCSKYDTEELDVIAF